MTTTLYPDLEQGTDEWHDVRRGIVTASTVGLLITSRPPNGISFACPECGAVPDEPCVSRARREPTPIKTLHSDRLAYTTTAQPILEPARNDTARSLTTQLVAERITGWTEPVYVNDDMMRGSFDEPIARDYYAEHHAPVTEMGFMVRDDWGVEIGYSPDGLVGDDGLIEIKSRRPKKHLTTILADAVPAENMAQIQCGLLVSGRAWCDYVSYAAGMPLWTKRVYPDPRWHAAIIAAAQQFEATAVEMVATYRKATAGLPITERTDHELGLVF